MRVEILIWLTLCLMLGLQPATTVGQSHDKSYSSFGSLTIEDNSMLLEEAFNQEMGAIQYIVTSWVRDNGTLDFSFTQEIPITDKKHQLSYTLNYFQRSERGSSTHGFGDIALGYRYQVLDENDWMMMIPRLSLVLPTGNSSLGFGNGSFGIQANVAVTKRLSKKIITHYNVGLTEFMRAKFHGSSPDGEKVFRKRNLWSKNGGVSFIWHTTRSLNLLVEYVALFEQEFQTNAHVGKSNVHILNPAARFSIKARNFQAVPAIGFPVVYDGSWHSNGMLVYLSIETNYQ
jgi:hypothetical protein